MAQTLTQPAYRIERGRTRLFINHQGEELAVAHPFYGPNTAAKLQSAIRADNLTGATAPEAISFLHTAYGNKNEKEFAQATDIMNQGYVRAFTAIVYNQKEGTVSFIDNPTFNSDGRINAKNLLDRLYANVPNIRTASLSNIEAGEKNPSQIAKDSYMIALFGKEGAAKVAGLADRHRNHNGYLWLPTIDNDDPVIRIAALGSDYGGYGGGLIVGGGNDGLGDGGRAFGVFPSGEARAQN